MTSQNPKSAKMAEHKLANLTGGGGGDRGFGGGLGGREVGAVGDAAGFPNPGAGVVGADFSRVTPGVQAEGAVVHSGGDVHGAAVHADDPAGTTQRPDEKGELC